jgi:uncharacterized protein (TIGR03083 family)
MIMNEDEVWAAIDTQRLRTADLLEGLSAAEWTYASLCDGWTIRDVAAHLTLQQLRLSEALRMALRHPGGLNKTIRESARRRAGLPTERLVSDIRGMVGSRRHNSASPIWRHWSTSWSTAKTSRSRCPVS